METLKEIGYKPKVHWLENETAPEILKYVKDNQI